MESDPLARQTLVSQGTSQQEQQPQLFLRLQRFNVDLLP
ncbi:hypothetical protein SAMN05216191_12712 [Paenibacillus jilunlii]|uniref:Uncharacterized protein n=1 Tax=Paenibacillus jilunlii TaxID=682956 RepID=A0A1G9YKG4_9BACL|nr:hypothetical protein SAMN05216191_12712 [Paenibacillus jilunlii]